MQQMRFDVRDIFKSTRLGLSLQRIWIQFLGLVAGYLGYLIFTYISFVTNGLGLSAGWKKYGLLPCLWSESPNWYSAIIFGIGVIWLLAVYLISATAVSRATYMISKGNHFYTWGDAFKFALRKAGAVLLSPIAILMMVVFFLIGGAIVGLLGKIPIVGEFGITLFTFIWFLAALVVVFFIIVLVIALIQAPSIIATTDDDAFEAVFQSFSLIWAQPWRFVLYEALSAAIAVIGLLVLAFLSKKAFIVMDRIFSYTMGADYINISAHGLYLLNVALIHSIAWINAILGDYAGLVYFSREFIPLTLPHSYQYVASYIFVFWMLVIGGVILSYGLASFNIGNTLTYIILRKKKDDENLLERKDAEEEQEEEITEESKAEELSEEAKEEVKEALKDEIKPEEPKKRTRRKKSSEEKSEQ